MNPFTFTTSDKRLLPEGAGCANTVPTRGGRHSKQTHSQSQATFPSAPLISEAALDFSGGTNPGSFPVTVAGSWLVSPPSRENEHPVSQGGVPTGAPEVTVTHRTPAERDLPTPGRAAWVPQHGPPEHTQKVAPAPSHTWWVPLPSQLLLHGHNKVLLKFIDIWFDQLLGQRGFGDRPQH